MFKSDFSFFKAGQGAFYGGRIFNCEDGKCWTIVYDCGTSSFVSGNTFSLNSEIDYFKNYHGYGLHDNTIDILFISHLDYDHVSGIARLIKEFNIKKIVIPYFPEEVRKFALLSIGEDIDPNMPFSEYENFIDNPYSYLIENSDQAIIHVITDEEADFVNNYEKSDNSDEIEPTTDNTDITIDGPTASNRILKYKNNLQFYLKKRWEFTCYYKSINIYSFIGLKKSLLKLLEVDDESQLTLENFKTILTTNRKKAHSCYKKHLSDINAHGLVLIHGPINFNHVCFENQIENSLLENDNPTHISHCFDGFYRRNRRIFLGTILMGDTSIKPGHNQIVFPAELEEKIRNSHVFQVPHHGSGKNWDSGAYNNLEVGGNLHCRVINVCNFGYGNTYGHPSPVVLNDLSHNIVLNTQFLRFTYRYHIHYDR